MKRMNDPHSAHQFHPLRIYLATRAGAIKEAGAIGKVPLSRAVPRAIFRAGVAACAWKLRLRAQAK